MLDRWSNIPHVLKAPPIHATNQNGRGTVWVIDLDLDTDTQNVMLEVLEGSIRVAGHAVDAVLPVLILAVVAFS